MAKWRVKFTDPFTDVVRDEFTLTHVSMGTQLGAVGTASAQIPIAKGDTTTGARIAASIRGSGATAMYIYRGGALWWPGLVWTKTPAVDEQGHPTVAIGASTFEQYWDRVRLGVDLPALPATDQLAIARSFVDHMQADPYANMNIGYDPLQLSGVIRDRVAYTAASRPSYLKMLTDLAQLDSGFEFTIQAFADPVTGARTRKLVLGYPTLSTGVTHRLSKPGAILGYTLPEDGTRAATYLVAQGNGVTSTVHKNSTALAAGYPRLDGTSSYSSVTDASSLETHATADLALATPPVIVPTLRVRLADIDLTPQSLGDSVRISIRDALYPSGLTATYRLVGMTVSPQERGAAETCDLILN
jgi:hypothetical protein